MKALLAVQAFSRSFPAAAEGSFVTIAEEVRDEAGLQKLVSASFGGGRYYQVEKSRFFVVDLMPTSGVPSTELFIFESMDNQLVLRVHVPRKAFVEMRAELHDGVLIVSEKAQGQKEWQARLHVLPG